MNARQIVASYLPFQAAGTAAWWALLLIHPASIGWFSPAAWPAAALLGFWLGDFLLLICGSLATACSTLTDHRWSAIAIWSLTAGVWYPALYCIGVSILTDEAWLASAMMVSMAGLTLAMATIHGSPRQQPATIRAHASEPDRGHGVDTRPNRYLLERILMDSSALAALTARLSRPPLGGLGSREVRRASSKY